MEEFNFRKLKFFILCSVSSLILIFIFGSGMLAYTDKPQFCYTCHSMMPTYSNWQASSHGPVKCSDCHSPHNLSDKIKFKATNGLRSLYDTVTGQVPDMIHLSQESREITMHNCIRCHESTLANYHIPVTTYCWNCHRIK